MTTLPLMESALLDRGAMPGAESLVQIVTEPAPLIPRGRSKTASNTDFHFDLTEVDRMKLLCGGLK